MDFEGSFASAPVRYALDDIDSDEELETCLNINKVIIQAELTQELNTTALTLIFGLEGPGNVYLHSLQNESPKVVGKVTRKYEDKETHFDILYLESKKAVLIPFVEIVEPEEAGQYTKAILSEFANKVERVVVLDSFTAVGYTSEVWGDDLTPPFLRVLQTSSATIVKGITLYESPNMIKGLSAAIVNQCEIHSIPCYDLLTLQESIYGKLLVTADILQAYNQGLNHLGLNLTFSESLMKDYLNTLHNSGRVDDNHHRLYL